MTGAGLTGHAWDEVKSHLVNEQPCEVLRDAIGIRDRILFAQCFWTIKN